MSSQPAAAQPPRVYSRADLDALRQMSRRDIFAALRSFDHAGMDDDAFTLAAADLLDPRRVPGLASLRSARDTAGGRSRCRLEEAGAASVLRFLKSSY